MTYGMVATFGLLLLWGFTSPGSANAQERGISGKWSGAAIDSGGKSDAFLVVMENEDGTLTGKWGSTGTELQMDKGERVTAEILRWESTIEPHRYVVQAKVNGKSIMLEYTVTTKEAGKIKGKTGTCVLTREPADAPNREGQAPPEGVADLLKAQVASARTVYESIVKDYQAGLPTKLDFENLYVWSVRWLNAERDLGKHPADRVATVEAHLGRMKQLEAMARLLEKGGVGLARHVTAAEFYRVEAEIWVTQAKGK